VTWNAPTGEEREILRREILTQAREIGSRVQDANKEDIDALVDEAIIAIRGENRARKAP